MLGKKIKLKRLLCDIFLLIVTEKPLFMFKSDWGAPRGTGEIDFSFLTSMGLKTQEIANAFFT